MNALQSQNYFERRNPYRHQFDGQAKRYLNKLLVKEVLKMLPTLLLFKLKQHQKLTFALIIAVFLMLLLAHQKGYAQKKSAGEKLDLENKHYPKNNVQVNLSSLALKNYNFSYERSLSRKISFVAGYRFMPLTTIGDVPAIKKLVENYLQNDDLKDKLSGISTSNKTYTGEFRFYGGKHPGARGFYLSLYGRYTNMPVNYIYTYETSTENYLIPLKSNLKGYGGGLMIGSKFLIAKRVTFDWYIIGGHYGKISGDDNAAINLSRMSAADKNNLKESIESDLTIIGEKSYVTATVDNAGVKTQTDGSFIGLRGLGFNLGIAF